MNKIFWSLPIFVFVCFLFACDADYQEPAQIRTYTPLIKSDIPYAENMDPYYLQNPEINSSWLSNKKKYVDFCYSWLNRSDSSYINITLSIAESIDDAGLVLEDKIQLQKNYWGEYIEPDFLNADELPVAGTKSIGKGRLFLRDNIVVSIKTGFQYSDIYSLEMPNYSIPELAFAVDKKIKQSKTYHSANEFIPVIKDIVFEKYPVPYAEFVKVNLHVEPTVSILHSTFCFPPSIFYASTVTSGSIMLDSFNKVEGNEYRLCVSVVSKEGFCADSIFVIQLQP